MKLKSKESIFKLFVDTLKVNYKRLIKMDYHFYEKSLIIWKLFIAGRICGNKCISSIHFNENHANSKCHCGDNEGFGYKERYYCCTPQNSTCTKEDNGNVVKCPKGKRLKIDDFCDYQGQCPVSTSSTTAVTSDCQDHKNTHCPKHLRSSRICDVFQSLKIEHFCRYGTACPKAKEGLVYKQCYDQ